MYYVYTHKIVLYPGLSNVLRSQVSCVISFVKKGQVDK